jgi:hypothetical protein
MSKINNAARQSSFFYSEIHVLVVAIANAPNCKQVKVKRR